MKARGVGRDQGLGVELRAPFSWWGGKRKFAQSVWQAMGDVESYIEPFGGSLAVLLDRPDDYRSRKLEVVNDADAYISNFWRALAADPDAILRYCDWPHNEADLLARHLWLLNTGKERLLRLESDPDYYDAQAAGWWVWGINAWIGFGWCTGEGPHTLASVSAGLRRADAADRGTSPGVARRVPNMHPAGVHRQIFREDRDLLRVYLFGLAERLRHVRVCCGDWRRVLSNGVLAQGKSVGVFLDPPYTKALRSGGAKAKKAKAFAVDSPAFDADAGAGADAEDAKDIAADVRAWAIEHGTDPRLRVALCGYLGEHAMPNYWRPIDRLTIGYLGNKYYERIWVSPACPGDTPKRMPHTSHLIPRTARVPHVVEENTVGENER